MPLEKTAKKKLRKKRAKKQLSVIGWREWISLPDLGVDKISAKVDTGASTSSLYATHIKVFEQDNKEFAKFRVTYGKPGKRKFSTTEAPLVGFRKIKSSSGETEERPVILTSVCIMGQCWKSEITLTSRQS
ncbi:MAG: ATP-dependent zinc protease, partial [Phycisphaerales bacterium]|nr:ATP-dependent zinc protease [Phycisphaerales bacterium]